MSSPISKSGQGVSVNRTITIGYPLGEKNKLLNSYDEQKCILETVKRINVKTNYGSI